MNRKIRQENPIGAAPPPPIVAKVVSRRVNRDGGIAISRKLPQGTKINLIQISNETFLVSTLPADEVARIAETMPAPKPSRFAALSEKLRGLRHDAGVPRVMHAPADTAFVSLTDEEALSRATLHRAQRVR